ncbi:MAG: energy transducer TonB [Candidatus Cybelea sp.]|jgi:TonB family protein
MKRARRVLLVAFAFSLLLHAIVALVLHPATADFQSQPEAISVVRRSTVIVAHNTPPPHRMPTPAPRNLTPPRPRASGAAVARSEGGGPSRTTPPPPPPAPTLLPSPAGAGCAQPNAAAAVIATPGPPDIPAAVRADRTNGTALVTVALDPQGSVTGASVAQSTGNSSLDLVAVAMARDARYSAPLHDCKPIAGDATFSVKFVAW